MPLPSINIPNAAGISTPVNTPNSGRQNAVDSAATVWSNEDLAAIVALGTTLTSILTKLNASVAITAAALPLPPGAATEATLGNILTKLGTQRVETLWTDDTGAFFVRVDNAGTISWTDTSGTASSAPGTGSRPAAGSSIVLDKSSYQATAGGTGYSIGDLLDHIITTDPATGAVLSHFWINTTTEAKLASAPSSANITPLSPLGTGASTAANQATALGYLSTIATNAASTAPSPVIGPGKWETVATSQTDQVLGSTGATGDFLSHVLIVPATTSPGAVSIKDGSGSSITIFTGGASSVSNLVAFAVPLGLTSLAGAWKITTGANVSAIGVGLFT